MNANDDLTLLEDVIQGVGRYRLIHQRFRRTLGFLSGGGGEFFYSLRYGGHTGEGSKQITFEVRCSKYEHDNKFIPVRRDSSGLRSVDAHVNCFSCPGTEQKIKIHFGVSYTMQDIDRLLDALEPCTHDNRN